MVHIYIGDWRDKILFSNNLTEIIFILFYLKCCINYMQLNGYFNIFILIIIHSCTINTIISLLINLLIYY